MNGEVALRAMLVAHGNLFLHRGDAVASLSTPAPDHTTLKWIVSLAFVNEGATVATDPANWFRYLRSRGTLRLRFAGLPPAPPTPITTDLGPALQYRLVNGIQAETAHRPDFWDLRWSLTGEPAPRVWKVVADLIGRTDAVLQASTTVSEAMNDLRATLEAAREFSGLPHMDAWGQPSPMTWWATYFADALAKLEWSSDTAPAPLPLLPSIGYPAEAYRLLDAASASATGGMGGWTDRVLMEPDQTTLHVLEGRLFAAQKRAIVAAINSFNPALC